MQKTLKINFKSFALNPVKQIIHTYKNHLFPKN
jgi:hypothetical protein